MFCKLIINETEKTLSFTEAPLYDTRQRLQQVDKESVFAVVPMQEDCLKLKVMFVSIISFFTACIVEL